MGHIALKKCSFHERLTTGRIPWTVNFSFFFWEAISFPSLSFLDCLWVLVVILIFTLLFFWIVQTWPNGSKMAWHLEWNSDIIFVHFMYPTVSKWLRTYIDFWRKDFMKLQVISDMKCTSVKPCTLIWKHLSHNLDRFRHWYE